MRRFVSLLLIPMFVLGQALPHSHAGTGVGVPGDHSHRPHVHLGVDEHHHCDHHGHHHDDADEHGHPSQGDVAGAPNGLSIPLDHDSDAVYLPATDWTLNRVVSLQFDVTSTFVSIDGCPGLLTSQSTSLVAAHPPDRSSPLPIYLLTASLRL